MIENKFYKLTSYDGSIYYLQFSHLEDNKNMIKNIYFFQNKGEIFTYGRVEYRRIHMGTGKIELL